VEVEIADPALAVPLPIEARLDAVLADDAIVRAGDPATLPVGDGFQCEMVDRVAHSGSVSNINPGPDHPAVALALTGTRERARWPRGYVPGSGSLPPIHCYLEDLFIPSETRRSWRAAWT